MNVSDQVKPLLKSFGTPPEADIIKFAPRLMSFCEALIETNKLSAQYHHACEQLCQDFAPYQGNEQQTFERRKLYSRLKEWPLYSTILLLPFAADDQLNAEIFKQLNALLARLYLCRGASDYSAYLQFFKAFIDKRDSDVRCETLLSLDFIYSATSYEIQIELLKIAKRSSDTELHALGAYYRRPRQKSPTISKRSITGAANQHRTPILNTLTHQIEHIQATDEQGRHLGDYLQSTPTMQQTDRQERSSFRRQQVGLQRALYNAKVVTPWSANSVLPSELGELLDSINGDLIDAVFSNVTSREAILLCYFFLRIIGLKDVESLLLINRESPANASSDPAPNSIRYRLDRAKKQISAELILNAKLVQTNTPDVIDERLHYPANELFIFTVPFPIDFLMNIALRNTPSHRRKAHTFVEAFNIDRKDYRAWLLQRLKNSSITRTGRSIAHIERSFHNFARDSVPEVFLNLFTQRSSVQSHYLAIERSLIHRVVHQSWRRFIKAVGFSQVIHNTSASHADYVNELQYNDEVGSPLTVRDDVLSQLTSELPKHIKQLVGSDQTVISAFNLCVIYIYLRSALSLALRPVNEPFPDWHHFSEHYGLLSVSDKRTHHHAERRLLIVSRSLRELLKSFKYASKCISVRLGVSQSDRVVAYFETATGKWMPLSRSYINDILEKLIGDKVTSHSFRHNAARKFLKMQIETRRFNQSSLNLLMNHSRAGVSVINQRTLLSIWEISARQCDEIETLDSHYEHSDNSVLRSLEIVAGAFS